MTPHRKTLVFVPTYNERENVGNMCQQLLALNLDADILFLDDNSPDGTGAILDQLAADHPRVSVMHRSGKLGIGSAHFDGISRAYDLGCERLITLDCDFTHSPADIHRMLEKSAECDVAVASRYMREGSLPGWNLMRRSLTMFGHLLTKKVLRIPYDATGAFRVYNLSRIPRGVFGLVASRGYAFFFESLFLLDRNGASVGEVPIVLPARVYGHSKMSFFEAGRSAFHIFSIWAAEYSDPGRFRLDEPLEGIDEALHDPQGWDDYWLRKKDASGLLYDVIAALYRRGVIRRRLTAVIRQHFRPGSRLLHAGCGTGQADAEIAEEMTITAMDISAPALRLYRRNNPQVTAVKHASILAIPFAEGSFDGVYNLGVMEHFHEAEINRILSECYRVLKPGGKLVSFWPHAQASSVQVLGFAHWLMNHVFKRNVRLHPAEVSLIQSRRQARNLVQQSGFRLARYDFGPRDAFVQAVIVAEKPTVAGAIRDG